MEEDVRSLTTEVLLGGLGGALAVFILGGFREWWREEREREGLLLLLSDLAINSATHGWNLRGR